MTLQDMTIFDKWMLGIRPKTLPAAASPVVMAWGVAAATVDSFHWGAALAALFGALMIQVGTNFINDVMDFAKGADTTERLGPIRVTQTGLLTPKQVWFGVAISFGLATIAGGYLYYVAGWPVLLIGIASFIAGLAYTAGPYPLAYIGLADLFVMIFFGFVAVGGTVYVIIGEVPLSAWWVGVAAGALTVNILVVNNIRDIETDRQANRRNIPVVFGRKAAEAEYGLMVLVAYLVPLILIYKNEYYYWLMLVFFTMPQALKLYMVLRSGLEGKGLNKILGQTAQLLFRYGVLFAVGLIL